MKILVISDTHRNIKNARKIITKLKDKIEMIIHLGDNDIDAENLSYEFDDIPFEYIAGNTDFYSDNPCQKNIKIFDKVVTLTHGHYQNVKNGDEGLHKLAKDEKSDVVLYGHTHIPKIVDNDNLMIMNPGSLSRPRSNDGATYGILDIEKTGEIQCSIVKVEG